MFFRGAQQWCGVGEDVFIPSLTLVSAGEQPETGYTFSTDKSCTVLCSQFSCAREATVDQL